MVRMAMVLVGKKPVNVMYTEKVVWDSLSFLAVSKERALTFSSGEHEAKLTLGKELVLVQLRDTNRRKVNGGLPYWGSLLKRAGPNNPDWVVADGIRWSN